MCYRSARTAPPLCSRCASRQSREIIAALCLAPSPSPRCHRHSCARLSFGIRPLFLAALLDALGACVQRPLALGLVGQFFPRLFLCSVRPLAIACPLSVFLSQTTYQPSSSRRRPCRPRPSPSCPFLAAFRGLILPLRESVSLQPSQPVVAVGSGRARPSRFWPPIVAAQTCRGCRECLFRGTGGWREM